LDVTLPNLTIVTAIFVIAVLMGAELLEIVFFHHLAKIAYPGNSGPELLMAYYFVPKVLAMKIIYRTFLKRLAEGHKMKRDAVNEMAEGRIWLGGDALQIGIFGF
jgi:uncharacterized membrane protein YciS (DUF1049 family)